jgi:hypothetical protein
MDALAQAATSAVGWDGDALGAVYFETEAGGLERLAQADAALALVTLPFFLEHRQELQLAPVAQAVAAERSANEPWSLVTGAGRVSRAADLAGWQLISLAGHSPRFVSGPALGSWGALPESLSITFSGAVLSGLRKAARGDDVALLLDAHQAGALSSLPFADQLEVVHTSAELPVSMLCTVGERLDPERTAALTTTLLGLADRAEATEALAGVRIDRFVAVDQAALAVAVESFDEQ